MTPTANATILARHTRDEFVGRTAQIEKILSTARSGTTDGVAVLAAPSAGATELLRQAYDRLFMEAGDVVPIYFELKHSDRTAQAAALRFLCEFLIQTVAFRRGEPAMIAAAPVMAEVAEMAAPGDGFWIERLVTAYEGEATPRGERSFIRNCLGAPIRAVGNGTRTFVMFDGLEIATELDGGETLLDDMNELYSGSQISAAFSGLRRFMFARTPFQTLPLDNFSFAEAGQLIELLARKQGVTINDQTRDLIAVQLGGNARRIASLISAAAGAGRDLASFEQVEQVYTDEIFGGRMSRGLDVIFERAVPDTGARQKCLRLLSDTRGSAKPTLTISQWRKTLGISPDGSDRELDRLHYHELINLGAGQVGIEAADLVLGDYVSSRTQLEAGGRTRALIVGESLTANIKRAPALMARHYRRSASIGLRDLLQAFDGREVSPMLLNYAAFKMAVKGRDHAEAAAAIQQDTDKLQLPRVVYTANTTALYPPLAEICEPERSAAALGFTGPGEENDVAWIAAEVESKLEATADTAAFWCDRLEMAALNSNLRNYKLWLIATEGFDEAAMNLLDERGAFGSSRRQAMMLRETLSPAAAAATNANANEYEFVVPMGDDTEMIAAHAVEEIAKRHRFSPKAINQIKTAVVEACINATEHSLSPDRKIHQRFGFDGEKLTITISNRGLRLTDRPAPGSVPAAGRRGWGLKLMKGLMDDVRIEQTDDGTRITMVKSLS